MTELSNNSYDPNVPAYPVGSLLPLFTSIVNNEYVPLINGYRHVYYGENNIPIGFLPCDGRLVSRKQFPETFNVIRYNNGGSGDYFALPNIVNFCIKMDYKI